MAAVGEGDPGAVGARFRVSRLRRHHARHLVRHGPHALADLRVPREAAGQAHVHVPIFVGKHPPRPFDFGLGDHGAGAHVGVDFIARAIQEARVDEDDPFLGGLNASFQVNRSAAFLVHDADLQGVRRQPQHRFNAGEEVHGKGHLFRPMLLGLDDVHAARAAVA